MCRIYASLVEILLNKMSDCCSEHNRKMGYVTVVADHADEVSGWGRS